AAETSSRSRCPAPSARSGLRARAQRSARRPETPRPPLQVRLASRRARQLPGPACWWIVPGESSGCCRRKSCSAPAERYFPSKKHPESLQILFCGGRSWLGFVGFHADFNLNVVSNHEAAAGNAVLLAIDRETCFSPQRFATLRADRAGQRK